MFLRPNWQEMGSGVCARATFARAAAAMPPNRPDTKPRRWSSAKMFIASLPAGGGYSTKYPIARTRLPQFLISPLSCKALSRAKLRST